CRRGGVTGRAPPCRLPNQICSPSPTSPPPAIDCKLSDVLCAMTASRMHFLFSLVCRTRPAEIDRCGCFLGIFTKTPKGAPPSFAYFAKRVGDGDHSVLRPKDISRPEKTTPT